MLTPAPASQARPAATPARGLIPEPGLRRYFAAVFGGVLLALVLLSAGVLQLAKSASRERLVQAIETADRQAVTAMQREAHETLIAVTANLLFLRDLFENQLIELESWADLERITEAFMRRHRVYDQLRFFSPDGQEMLRVDNEINGAELTPAPALQDKAAEAYFRDALGLGERQILISQLELNRENGRIEQPPKPVIRVIAPVDSGGRRAGFIALNYQARRLLEQMNAIGEAAIGSPVAVNGLGIDALKLFLTPVNEQPAATAGFATRYPGAWQEITATREGSTEDGEGGFFLFSSYFPGERNLPDIIGADLEWTLPRGDGSGAQGGLYLVSHVDAATLARITGLGLGASTAVSLFFITVMVTLAWFVALRFAHLRGATRRMRTLASRDALTNLLSRGEFELRLQQVLALARRHDRAMALLYVDLDGFKQTNDSLGHAAGDEVLRRAAETLASTVRSSDLVGRIGGDEFAVVLTEIRGRHDTQAVAEKLRERLNTEVELAGRSVPMGASVGAATFPEDAENATSLFEAADQAMYREKSHRRSAATTPAAGAISGSALS